jgi:hypothetical protein
MANYRIVDDGINKAVLIGRDASGLDRTVKAKFSGRYREKLGRAN